MREFIVGGVIVVILLIVGSFFFGCERIDAGHAGVKVELYGSEPWRSRCGVGNGYGLV